MKKKYENEIKELKEKIEKLEQQYKYLENKDMKSFIEEKEIDTIRYFHLGKEFILHYINNQSKKYITSTINIAHINCRIKCPYMEIVKENKEKVYIIVRFRKDGISVEEDNMYIIFNKLIDSYSIFNHSQIKEINELMNYKENKYGRKKNV